MSTNRQVITHALGMLGVVDADETVQISDANLGLREMNNLFASLAGDDIDLGYPPQDNLSEDFPLDATTEAQITPLLAMVLMAHYPSSRPHDSLPFRADQAMNQLARAAVIANMEEARAAVPLGTGFTHAYDFDAGE